MLRKIIKYFLITFFSLQSVFAASNYTASPIHKHLFLQEDWFNLSKKITANDLAGRIILLDFWTYGCINCIHTIADIKHLETKYADKLTVIGIHSGKFLNERKNNGLESAIKKLEINHIVINDFDYKIWNTFGVNAWPTLVLIAPNGIIFSAYSGEGHIGHLTQDIDFLLQQYHNINVTSLPYTTETSSTSSLAFPSKISFEKQVKYQGTTQDIIFVSDTGNNRILALNDKAEVIFQIGSGKSGNKIGDFKETEFSFPEGTIYQNGKLYIADTKNHQIKVADLKKQQVSTILGVGNRAINYYLKDNRNPDKIALTSPYDIAFFPNKDSIIIANAGTHQLVKHNLNNNSTEIFAGSGKENIDDGIFPFNSLAQPTGLHVFKDELYFIDSETSSLRKIDANGKITTLIGRGLFKFGYVDGKYGNALMQHPLGLSDDGNNILIADSYNDAIRKFSIIDKYLDSFIGGNSMDKADLKEPGDVSNTSNPYIFLIADTNHHRILKFDIRTNKVSQFFPIIK